MVILQKQVGNQWVDIADASELVDGDVYRQSVGGKINPQGKLVGNGWEQKVYITPLPESEVPQIANMALFGELLPIAVLVELEDLKSKSTGSATGRESAIRTITRIYSGINLDIKSLSFRDLLLDLVANTSLTTEQVNEILDKLSQ
jgi:hypothetical protein